ncbi:MAG: response regulator with CheY-like receiver domain and winged-helix DNA-binding domain [Pedosphaera sp.]|nr:response regulator with CheY-like receiver domain and winged-helix DNA-binding domain [Pedosphaera sp.]
MAFERTGLQHRLGIVRDGDEAVKYLSGEGIYTNRTVHPLPDAVLLDLSIPGRNGHQVLQWIRTQPNLKKLPVVVLTGSFNTADYRNAMSEGATSYHLKPENAAGLQTILTEVSRKWLSSSGSLP